MRKEFAVAATADATRGYDRERPRARFSDHAPKPARTAAGRASPSFYPHGVAFTRDAFAGKQAHRG